MIGFQGSRRTKKNRDEIDFVHLRQLRRHGPASQHKSMRKCGMQACPSKTPTVVALIIRIGIWDIILSLY